MTTRDRHPIEAIHALVDGRLDARERAEVERHLAECATCRSERDLAESTRRIARETLPEPVLPAGLVESIGEALDAVDGEAERDPSGDAKRRPVWTWLLPVAAVVVLGLAVVLFRPGGPAEAPVGERIVATVAEDYGAVQRGNLTLLRENASAPELQAWFGEQDIGFENHVFDLGMMDFGLAGGRVRDLAGRKSTLFAYRGPDDVLMLCRMYLGTLAELPEPSRVLENDGIVFRVYERDGLTLVFWQEGEVVCVLVSDAPAQAVIDLSIAKAVKV